MPVAAMATPKILTNPGALLWAPLGTAEPTSAANAGGTAFTDSWPAGWIPVGATAEGSDFKADVKTENVTVAEFFDPIQIVTTERSASISFAMTDFTLTKLKWAMNGGAITVSGTAPATVSTYEPPDPGSEVRAMIGWESLDSSIRIICRQVFQAGTINPAFKKAPEKALIAVEFRLEKPASAKPWAFQAVSTRA